MVVRVPALADDKFAGHGALRDALHNRILICNGTVSILTLRTEGLGVREA